MKKDNENDFMLSTYDNPFDPFEDFGTWFKRDMILGHNCCGLLAIHASVSPIFSDEVNERLEDEAMDEIVSLDPVTYRKVQRSDFKKSVAVAG